MKKLLLLVLVCCSLVGFGQGVGQGFTPSLGGGAGAVDSTRLVQDSIQVYYLDGVEVGRDTVRVKSGVTEAQLTDSISTLRNEIPDNAILIDTQVVSSYVVGDVVRDYETGKMYRAVASTSYPADLLSDDWAPISINNNNPPSYAKISTDGFGSTREFLDLSNLQFTAKSIPVGGTIVGEAFLGATATEKYLFMAPQDGDAVMRYDLIKGGFDSVLVQYGNVDDDLRLRDKFNGIVYDGSHIYVTPSWSGPALKIDPETLEILEEYDVNTYGDDAYNGAVVVNPENKIFFIAHDAPTLKWIDKTDNSIGETDLSGLSGISLGVNSFLSGCYDGKSLWMYPRASTKMLEIDPKTGAVIGEYTHPAAATGAEPIGYFHGGSFDGRYIWFTPFNTDFLVWFDTVEKIYYSRPHGMTNVPNGSNDQYCLGSSLIDGLVYFNRFRSDSSLVVNTIDQTHKLVASNLPYISGGSSVVVNDKMYLIPAQSTTLYIADLSESVVSADNVRGVEIQSGLIEGIQGRVYYENGEMVAVPATATINSIGVSFNGTERILTGLPNDFDSGGTFLVDVSGYSGNNKRILTTASSFNSGDGIDFTLTASGKVFMRYSTGVYITAAAIGTTQRFAISFGPDGFKFYREGVSGVVEADTEPWSNFTTNAYNLTIGNTGLGDRPLEATIEELIVYNSVLSDSDISTFLNSGIGEFISGSPILKANFTEESAAGLGGLYLYGSLYDAQEDAGEPGQLLSSSGDSRTNWIDPPVIPDVDDIYATISSNDILSGGGIVTWNNGRVKWSSEINVGPIPKKYGLGGRFTVSMPAIGSVLNYRGGINTAVSTDTLITNSDGIRINSGEALFYKLPLDENFTSVTDNFLIVNPDNSTWEVAEGWVLLASRDRNVNVMKWLPGSINMPIGTTNTYNFTTDEKSWGNEDSGEYTATQDVDFASFKGVNLADPTSAQDAATKAYVDANSGGADNLGNHTATQDINLGGFEVTNAADATTPTALTTQQQVDAKIAALSLTATATLDFPEVATANSADLTIAVTGAIVGKPVILGGPLAPSGTHYDAQVTSAGVVTVRFYNHAAGATDPASATFTVKVLN